MSSSDTATLGKFRFLSSPLNCLLDSLLSGAVQVFRLPHLVTTNEKVAQLSPDPRILSQNFVSSCGVETETV